MYKETIQQVLLFIVTTFVIIQTGKYMVALTDIRSFKDFFIVMIFFIAFVLFINYFSRLASKLYRAIGI